MAEGLLHDALSSEGVVVESAGIAAVVGAPAVEQSVGLMASKGLDISGHRARQITPEMTASADLVLVMESSHKRSIEKMDITSRGKVFRLGEWHGLEIDDPYRQRDEVFAAVFEDIMIGVADWIERIRKV